MLKLAQPEGIHIKQAIGPWLVADRIAGMHIAWVDDNHGAHVNAFLHLAIEINAVSTSDRTDGKCVVRMPVVADPAAVLDGTSLDKRQCRITPKLCGRSLFSRKSHVAGLVSIGVYIFYSSAIMAKSQAGC